MASFKVLILPAVHSGLTCGDKIKNVCKWIASKLYVEFKSAFIIFIIRSIGTYTLETQHVLFSVL